MISISIVQMALGSTSDHTLLRSFRSLTSRKVGMVPPLKNMVNITIFRKTFRPSSWLLDRG